MQGERMNCFLFVVLMSAFVGKNIVEGKNLNYARVKGGLFKTN